MLVRKFCGKHCLVPKYVDMSFIQFQTSTCMYVTYDFVQTYGLKNINTH